MTAAIMTAAMGITTRATRMLEWFGEMVLRCLEGSTRRQAVLLVLGLNALLITGALLLPGSRVDPMFHFRELRLLTFLSAFQLVTVSALALQVYLRHRKCDAEAVLWRLKPHHLWLVVAAGFAFLAADELAMIHEIVDKLIHFVGRIEETPLTDQIDDVIIALYAVGALGVLYIFRSELMAFRDSWFLFVLAFAFLGLTVVLDLKLTNFLQPYLDAGGWALISNWRGVVEEVCKLTSECFFVGALYGCVLETA